MARIRPAILGMIAAVVWIAGGLAAADDITFIPLAMNQGDTEATTGMWLRPDLGKPEEILPLKTRVWATQESVTGKAAMKVVFEKGSTGKLAWELMDGSLKANSAGITLYAKCSRAAKIAIGNIPCEVGTAWTKLDLPWEKLGTTAAQPSLGWQFIVVLQGPIEERTTLILDRIGMESPRFDSQPKLDITAGPDKQVASADFTYGANNLAPTLARLKGKKPFKLIAFGDSVTAGAQAYRSTWAVKAEEVAPYLFFAEMARQWEAHFGYKGITPVQRGHGGWTAEQGLNVIDKDVVAEATADDLVIIEFGGNDTMAGKTPDQWKADTEKLIARVKTKTNQILLLTSTPNAEQVKSNAPGITKCLKELVTEQKVAAFDTTQFLLARGDAYMYGLYANLHHPDFCGHLMLGEQIATVLTGEKKMFP